MDASRDGGRRRASSTRHEPDFLRPPPSPSIALAPRRRPPLSTQFRAIHAPGARPIPSKSRLGRFSRSLARSRGQACTSPRSRVAAPIEPALASNRHSARRPPGANLPATSCLDAFWTPAACACGKSRGCRRPKTCTRAAVADWLLWRATPAKTANSSLNQNTACSAN